MTDPLNRRFRPGWFLLIAALILVALFVVCDGDEGPDDDLGWVPPNELADGDDNRGGRNDNGRECEDTEDCSSFSPSFEDSPVILCLPNSVCNF